MIPNYQNRELETHGVTASSSFGISLDDSAHIMTILRDTLYSDKVLAVLREYSANAWDAHKMVGKGDLPIKVTLPTRMDPTLTIQDFGPGLSHDDVFNVYTQYGASTKRGSNSAVGQLGIGSKSGFAYSDSFTITSCHGGKQRTYVALLDDTEKGTINLLDEHDCEEGETGVSIQIPIKPEDIPEFVEKAENLFQFFSPRPDINVTLPDEIPVKMRLQHGLLYEDGAGTGDWVAVMGCIPYRVNLDQLNITEEGVDESGVGYWVHNLSGALFFNIGEVHISASREELKYSKSTKQALIKKFNDLIDEYVAQTLAAIEGSDFSSWEKRIRTQILTKLRLPIPKSCKDMAKDSVSIQGEPKDFAKTFNIMHRDTHSLRHISVAHGTKLLLKDDTRKLVGFNLDSWAYLIVRKEEEGQLPAPWEEVTKELDEYLLANKLDGIPIGKLSEQTWYPPFVHTKPKKIVNPKHLRKSFTLSPSKNGYYAHPYSRYWEATDTKRLATDEDVFVIIDGFKTEGWEFFTKYSNDLELAEYFSKTMPVVYGYKTTHKKPLTPADCAGIEYRVWQERFTQSLIVDEKVQKLMGLFQWKKLHRDRYEWYKPDIDKIKLALGKDHAIVQFLKKVMSAHKKWRKFKDDKQKVITRLSKRIYKDDIEDKKSDPVKAHDAIFERYPLLGVGSGDGLEVLWRDHSTQWLEYIQLIDRVIPMGIITLTPVGDEEKEEDIEDDDVSE